MRKLIFILVATFTLLGCESEKESFDMDIETVTICRGDSSIVCQKDSVCTNDSTICVKDTTK